MDSTQSESGRRTIQVPVSVLAKKKGIVARDVKTRDGKVLLPAGVDLSMFSAALGSIVRKMTEYGIDHVFVTVGDDVMPDADVDKVIDKLYGESGEVINKQKAASIIGGVDDLFRSFERDMDDAEALQSMRKMGTSLARDMMTSPSLAFSLGKVKAADEYTYIHSFNVAVICGHLANRLHPGDEMFIRKMVLGGLLHDIGKAKVPRSILNKPGALTPHEFAIMQKHPTDGVKFAAKSGITDTDILAVIGGHHERWNGTGYPNKRAGEDIPEPARIAAIADVFDALTAKRAYNEPISSHNAVSAIMNDSGTNFDPKIGREFLVSIGLYPPGSIVLLSDGREAIVVSGGGRDLMRPIVMLIDEALDDETSRVAPTFIDLRQSRELRIMQYLSHGGKRDLGLGLLGQR